MCIIHDIIFIYQTLLTRLKKFHYLIRFAQFYSENLVFELLI